MKILVVSDIHNDIDRAEMIVSIFRKDQYDKLYILGDIGEDAIYILNDISTKITAVCGNCDTYDEEDAAKFNMPLLNYDYQFGKMIVLTHGHYYNEYNYNQKFDIMFQGHSHIGKIYEREDGVIFANPGSISRPRDMMHSYIRFTEKSIELIDADSGSVAYSLELKKGKRL